MQIHQKEQVLIHLYSKGGQETAKTISVETEIPNPSVRRILGELKDKSLVLRITDKERHPEYLVNDSTFKNLTKKQKSLIIKSGK